MKIKLNNKRECYPTIQILDYEKLIGVELIATERDNKCLPRFYVHFEGSDIKDGCMLLGETGNGETIDLALRDYANKIAGKTLVIGACTKNRKEFECPNLIHTCLLLK